MGIISINFNQFLLLFLTGPILVAIFCIGVLSSPAYIQKILYGGRVRIVYVPEKTRYIDEVIPVAPEFFKAVRLDPNYIFGVFEKDGRFHLGLFNRKTHEIVQHITDLNYDYASARKIATRYAELYDSEYTRIFDPVL